MSSALAYLKVNKYNSISTTTTILLLFFCSEIPANSTIITFVITTIIAEKYGNFILNRLDWIFIWASVCIERFCTNKGCTFCSLFFLQRSHVRATGESRSNYSEKDKFSRGAHMGTSVLFLVLFLYFNYFKLHREAHTYCFQVDLINPVLIYNNPSSLQL